MSKPLRVIPSDQLVPADPTSGMHRSLAFEVPGLWSGRLETDPGSTSGWHHHDVNESSLYVVSGVVRLEFEGREGYVEAGPGDFVHVPPHTIHRESNPGTDPAVVIIARAGDGVPTVNVDSPPAPHA